MKKKYSVYRIKRLLSVQLTVCLVIAFMAWWLDTRQAAVSALLAGVVALIPSMIFANKLFQYQGAQAAKDIVKSFYLAECWKIIATVGLFGLVFMIYKVVPLVFFLTYIALVMTHWLSPLLIDNQHYRSKK